MACTAAAGGGMGAALVRSQQNIEIVLQAGVHAIEAQLPRFSLVEAKQLLAAEIRGRNRMRLVDPSASRLRVQIRWLERGAARDKEAEAGRRCVPRAGWLGGLRCSAGSG
jgi:hypothetical protein